jgi:peptidoglycan/LPS O-acetylase OafA/YrhL
MKYGERGFLMSVSNEKNNIIENKHYDYVDSLRGLAILGVIAVHTGQHGSFNVSEILKTMTNNAQMGVQLFYIMSAFTLFISLKNRFVKERYPIKNFFIRRFFRIAPMFYIAIIVYFIAWRQWGIGFGNILSHFLFLHGFRPSWINTLVPGGWSVGVEMMFYAILPILFLKIKNINHAINLFLISNTIRPLVNRLLSSIIDIGEFGDYWFYYLPNQIPIFCLGIILYFLIFENEKNGEVKKVSLLFLSISILAQLFTGKAIFYTGHILFGIGFTIFAYALSKNHFKMFVNRLFKYFGKISFSMYLCHFEIFTVLEKIDFIDYVDNQIINYLIRFVLVVLITVMISSVSYNLIEIPFQNFGKKIIKNYESNRMP